MRRPGNITASCRGRTSERLAQILTFRHLLEKHGSGEQKLTGTAVEFRVAMRPGKRRGLPDTPEGKLLNLIEMAKTHVRAKAEQPFQAIKQQFGFQKSRLRGMAKNRCNVNVLAAQTILFLARRLLLMVR